MKRCTSKTKKHQWKTAGAFMWCRVCLYEVQYGTKEYKEADKQRKDTRI